MFVLLLLNLKAGESYRTNVIVPLCGRLGQRESFVNAWRIMPANAFQLFPPVWKLN
jgi:hypothetical protein